MAENQNGYCERHEEMVNKMGERPTTKGMMTVISILVGVAIAIVGGLGSFAGYAISQQNLRLEKHSSDIRVLQNQDMTFKAEMQSQQAMILGNIMGVSSELAKLNGKFEMFLDRENKKK
jgi:uncharacterized protein HemX